MTKPFGSADVIYTIFMVAETLFLKDIWIGIDLIRILIESWLSLWTFILFPEVFCSLMGFLCIDEDHPSFTYMTGKIMS